MPVSLLSTFQPGSASSPGEPQGPALIHDSRPAGLSQNISRYEGRIQVISDSGEALSALFGRVILLIAWLRCTELVNLATDQSTGIKAGYTINIWDQKAQCPVS